MTAPAFAPATPDAIPLLAVGPEGLDAALDALLPDQAAWARTLGFQAGSGEGALLPGAGGLARVLVGRGKPEARARERFALAKAAPKLPEGTYRLEGTLPERDLREGA
ncbi:MAG TPA: leucyl aminopeptidase family protein, partial [Rubellimicrobium sp.]|nr:leucyl aminopeptidase family protein [Rubellimicrobium sp.]